jgi:hypothetical protein
VSTCRQWLGARPGILISAGIVFRSFEYSPSLFPFFSHVGRRSSHDIATGYNQDRTGLMGTSTKVYGGPRFCFNGQKYALSGWMASTTQVIDVSQGPVTTDLVAFTDRTATGEITLLRIPSADGADVHLVYNRQKSFNDGTREGGNLVTLTQTIPNVPTESNRLAMLDSDQEYGIPNSGIVVRVCSKGSSNGQDYATVSIFDTSRGQGSACTSHSQPQEWWDFWSWFSTSSNP